MANPTRVQSHTLNLKYAELSVLSLRIEMCLSKVITAARKQAVDFISLFSDSGGDHAQDFTVSGVMRSLNAFALWFQMIQGYCLPPVSVTFFEKRILCTQYSFTNLFKNRTRTVTSPKIAAMPSSSQCLTYPAPGSDDLHKLSHQVHHIDVKSFGQVPQALTAAVFAILFSRMFCTSSETECIGPSFVTTA